MAKMIANRTGERTYSVTSERIEGKTYIVNLELQSCSCLHHVHRGARCKHIASVEAQAPFIERLEMARTLTDTQIEQLLPKYAEHPVIGGALRVERQRRREEFENEERLRDIFA